jgi:hypothetical protein
MTITNESGTINITLIWNKMGHILETEVSAVSTIYIHTHTVSIYNLLQICLDV